MTGIAILSQKYLRQDSFTSSILQVKGHNLCAWRVHCTLLVLCLVWRHRRVRNLCIWHALCTTESLFDVTSQESTQPAYLTCTVHHWVFIWCDVTGEYATCVLVVQTITYEGRGTTSCMGVANLFWDCSSYNKCMLYATPNTPLPHPLHCVLFKSKKFCS